MDDIGEERGLTTEQLSDLAEWKGLFPTDWVGVSDSGRHYPEDLYLCLKGPVDLLHSAAVFESVLFEISELIRAYHFGETPLRRCSECHGWFVYTERFSHRTVCSRRCQKRGPTRKAMRHARMLVRQSGASPLAS